MLVFKRLSRNKSLAVCSVTELKLRFLFLPFLQLLLLIYDYFFMCVRVIQINLFLHEFANLQREQPKQHSPPAIA